MTNDYSVEEVLGLLSSQIQSQIQESKLFSTYTCALKPSKFERVHNAKLETEFEEKKEALWSAGRQMETLQEQYGYLAVTDHNIVKKILQNGLTAEATYFNPIGCNERGVYVCKHSDLALQFEIEKFPEAGSVWLVMFKFVLGRETSVQPKYGTNLDFIPCTLGYDAHVSEDPVTTEQGSKGESLPAKFIRAQVFLYEFEDGSDTKTVKRPRQVVPYAVITYSKEMPKNVMNNPTLKALIDKINSRPAVPNPNKPFSALQPNVPIGKPDTESLLGSPEEESFDDPQDSSMNDVRLKNNPALKSIIESINKKAEAAIPDNPQLNSNPALKKLVDRINAKPIPPEEHFRYKGPRFTANPRSGPRQEFNDSFQSESKGKTKGKFNFPEKPKFRFPSAVPPRPTGRMGGAPGMGMKRGMGMGADMGYERGMGMGADMGYERGMGMNQWGMVEEDMQAGMGMRQGLGGGMGMGREMGYEDDMGMMGNRGGMGSLTPRERNQLFKNAGAMGGAGDMGSGDYMGYGNSMSSQLDSGSGYQEFGTPSQSSSYKDYMDLEYSRFVNELGDYRSGYYSGTENQGYKVQDRANVDNAFDLASHMMTDRSRLERYFANLRASVDGHVGNPAKRARHFMN